MKVLFLDFDGVLNYFRWFAFNEHLKKPLWFCESAMRNLDLIIKSTGTFIVLSTSHRFNPESVEKFKNECTNRGWGDIVIGRTDSLHCDGEYSGDTRSLEIKRYIDTHRDIDSWAILDDVPIPLNNSVYVDYNWGLTRRDANEIINMLNTTNRYTVVV